MNCFIYVWQIFKRLGVIYICPVHGGILVYGHTYMYMHTYHQTYSLLTKLLHVHVEQQLTTQVFYPVGVDTYTYIHVYAHTHAHAHTYICMYTPHTYTCTHHIHTHTHAYTYIPSKGAEVRRDTTAPPASEGQADPPADPCACLQAPQQRHHCNSCAR